MRNRLLVRASIAAALAAASCRQLEFAAQGGYAQLAIEGEMALDVTTSGGAGALRQDVEDAFGLGQHQGTPYARAQVDFGVPVLSVSGFMFEERGRGTLVANFGNITAGSDVESELEFDNIKGSLTFEIPLGPVSLAPGLAVDFIDLDMRVADTLGFATEEIDVQAPIPLLYLAAALDLDAVAIVGELGYIEVPDYEGVDGTFWDAELLAELRLSPSVHLFGGYRIIDIDAVGDVDGQDFATDLSMSGWVVGGGVRF